MGKFFAILVFYTYVYSITYDDCSSRITPNESESIIACNNNCNTCFIDCINDNSCLRSQIYSGALTTEIQCIGIDSCLNASIYIGHVTDDWPMEYGLYDFDRNGYNIAQIICQNENSCYGSEIEIEGNFIAGATISALGSGKNRIKDAQIDIDLGKGHTFEIYCNGTDTDTVCLDTEIECNHFSNCICDGIGCSYLSNGGIQFTMETDESDEEPETATKDDNKKNKNAAVIATVIIVIVILIAGIGIFILYRKKGGKSDFSGTTDDSTIQDGNPTKTNKTKTAEHHVLKTDDDPPI